MGAMNVREHNLMRCQPRLIAGTPGLRVGMRVRSCSGYGCLNIEKL